MVDTRGGTEEARDRDVQPTPPAASMESDSYSDTPAVLQPESRTPIAGLRKAGRDTELWALLKALPTRANIELLIGRIETQHRKEMQKMTGEMKSLSTRLLSGETSVADLGWRVSDLEHLHDAQIDSVTMLQHHMEEMEDRSRCNNLRLWGLPEATGAEDLAATATDIFCEMLGEALPP